MTDLAKGVSYEQAMRRIYSEYAEMPGLQLTCRQAQRLFGLGEHLCGRLLNELVAQKFLARQANGTYRRLADGGTDIAAALRPRPGVALGSAAGPTVFDGLINRRR